MLHYIALLCAGLAACTQISLADPRPNVIFILADDYGYHDIGYHGSEIQTPTLDKLAADGLKLENYYIQPICTPSRSQLMSGRYQIHTGLQHGIIRPTQPNALPLNSPTLADKMKESGYATHMVGKWHLGFYKKEYLPWNRGFDTYFGYLLGAEDYYTHKRNFEETPFLDLHTENGPVFNETGHYSAHLFTQKAIDIVKTHPKNKPFFLYLAYQSVHGPLQVPERYTEKYKFIDSQKRRVYAGMVSAMDEGIANLTQTLRDSGLWDNTLLVFSTDNGGKNIVGGSNYPLRGEKGTLWDGGMHGNGFVTGGALNPDQRGKVNHDLIHISDWYPTLVSGVAQGHLNGCLPLDGYNQWQTINFNAPTKRDVILHNIDILYEKKGHSHHQAWDTSVRAALRSGDYKLITGDPGPGTWFPKPSASSEDDNSLYFESEKVLSQNVWLFNITADPNERVDLSAKHPEVVESMMKMLSRFNATAVPPRYPQHDPNSNPALHGNVWGPWE